MTTLNFDFGTLALFITILTGLTFAVYCIGALVIMLVGISIVSVMIIVVALIGAVMVLVHLIKHY